MMQEFGQWFLPGIVVATPSAKINGAESGSSKPGVSIERTDGSKFSVDASSCKSAHHIMHKLMQHQPVKVNPACPIHGEKKSIPNWLK